MLFLFLLLVGFVVSADGSGSKAAAPHRVTLLSYNVYNYLASDQKQIKTPESRAAVLDIIATLAPDIMVLIETGGTEVLQEMQETLDGRGLSYPFLTVVEGADGIRQIGLLARFAPTETSHNVSATYRLRERTVLVRRGFAHCTFRWENGYVLHLIGAHLKSKHFDPLGQTDMRRYEARLLRYMYNDILKDDPEANVLIVGDLNDTPDSSPISTLCGRRYKRERQLYDLRPVDPSNLSWTHYWEEADTYSRIDYAFASYHLLPEILLDDTRIPFPNDWSLASDHRPLLITLCPEDHPVSEEMTGRFERNFRLPTPLPSSLHEGRIIGRRKVQRGD